MAEAGRGQAGGAEAGADGMRRRGGIRRASGGFEAEFRDYLQRRLRFWAFVTASLLFVVWGFDVVTWTRVRGRGLATLLDADLLSQGLGWVAALLAAVYLGRAPRPRAVLAALDAALLWGLSLVALVAYHQLYERGGGRALPFLGIVIMTRAVVVPSRAARTLVLALVPVAAVVGLQLLHGFAGEGIPSPSRVDSGAPFSGSWWTLALWDQVFLGICVAVATVASRANFKMRMQAYEAKRIDEYEIVAPLGFGGMGEVYRAQHALMRRPVALKFVRSEVADERTLRRFENEVQETCRLSHPNTISIYDYGVTGDGSFYYAMELIDGADLERIVRATGPFAASRVIHVLEQACGALHEAHSLGMVHRDVKPANVALCRRGMVDDVVKLMDFGLVKDVAAGDQGLSEAGAIIGSPETIAPESLRGAEPAPAADLYGLAAVGYWCLAGQVLFPRKTIAEVVSAHLNDAPVPPSSLRPGVPADLERVLLRSLLKEPEARHPDVLALRDDLLRCADAGRWSPADATAWWAANRDRLRPAAPHDGAAAPPP